MECIPKTTHILIFTETWITSESDAKLYQIQNYKHAYNYRQNNKGGGVSIFIHNSIKYEITEELCENGNHFLWIHIDKLSLNIGAIYKPGDTNLSNFLDIYSTQLERRRRAIVFGDFNVDLLSSDSHATKYQNEIKGTGYELLNKINRLYSTRETSTTNTILDHVCTNINNHSFNMSIIDSSLSDHKQIYLEIACLAPKIKKKILYTAIDYKSLHENALKARYKNDENEYYVLENFVLEQVNNSRIQKTKIVNRPQEDWITKDILNAINLRNDLWQLSKSNSKDEELQNSVNKEQNRVKTMIRERKRNYYYTMFKNNVNNPKKKQRTAVLPQS